MNEEIASSDETGKDFAAYIKILNIVTQSTINMKK